MRFANGTLIFEIPGFEDSEDRCVLDATGLRVCWVDVAGKRVVVLQKVPVSKDNALLPTPAFQAAADAEEPICFIDFVGVNPAGKQAWLRVDSTALQPCYKPGARSLVVPRTLLRKLTAEEAQVTGAVEVRLGEAESAKRASEVEASYRSAHATLAGRLTQGGYQPEDDAGVPRPLRVLYLPPKGTLDSALAGDIARFQVDLSRALEAEGIVAPVEVVSGVEDFKRRYGEKPRNLRAAYRDWPRDTAQAGRAGGRGAREARYHLTALSVTLEGCLGSGAASVGALWLKQGQPVVAWAPEGRGVVRLVNGLTLISDPGVRPEVWKVKIQRPQGQGE